MGTLTEVSQSDFDAVLDRQGGARPFQILQGAFLAGTIGFGLVVVALAVLGKGAQDPEQPWPLEGATEILTILSIVHVVQAVICWGLAFFLYGAAFSPAGQRIIGRTPLHGRNGLRVPYAEQNPDAAETCIALIRTATILRLALLEGVALFGLVICLLGVLQGKMASAPVYWLNAISAVAFVVFSTSTFPSRERLLDVFRRKIKAEAG